MSQRSTVERVELGFAAADIADLRERIARTRRAPDPGNEEWSYGTNGAYLAEVLSYWAHDFDWDAFAAHLNRYEHFRTEIDGVPLHFARLSSGRPGAQTLVLLHGWPWTFLDFDKAAALLVGDDDGAPFDLILPSLPGFGFSTPLEKPVGVPEAARLIDTLVHSVLGVERYAVAGGDFGSTVAAYIAHAHSEHIVGAHLTYPALLGQAPDAFAPEKYSDDEAGWFEGNLERAAVISAHIVVQVMEPASLAYGMNDSPAGLAGWLLDRRFALSDHQGHIEDVYTKDELCRLLSIYWMTSTIGSSMRFYADTLRQSDEFYRLPLVDDSLPILKAPVAVAVFPKEVFRAPRSAVEQYANLQRWTVMPVGGHYAPFEQPELWASDVRAFFAPA